MAEKYNDEPTTRAGADGGAQIYRDRKGLPAWLWPLLLLLLLGLLWALFHHGSNQQAQTAPAASAPVAAAAPDPNAAPVAAAGTDASPAGQNIKVHSGADITTAKAGQASVPGVPLSDVVALATATDPTAFVGRKAQLKNVQVQKVVTDRAFFVGPSPQQQVLVLLDKGMNAGAGGASKVTVAAGQPVSLTGIVEAMPTQEAVNQTYGVSGADYAAIQGQKAYLHATVAQQK